jgi:hypothetical protein
MKLRLLYEDFDKQPQDIQEAMLIEMPQGQFAGRTDNSMLDELLLSGTFSDLGFEDLAKHHGLSYKELATQLTKTGFKIPNTSARVRHPFGLYGIFKLEPSDGSEPTLPDDWIEFIQIAKDGQLVFYGKKVRPDRRASDPENFEKTEHGFKLKVG